MPHYNYPTGRHVLSKPRSKLSKILDNVAHVQALNAWIRPLLPADLSPHCEIAALREETLVFIVDSPAWLTRLRFSEPALLRTLNQTEGMPTITKIKWRVGRE